MKIQFSTTPAPAAAAAPANMQVNLTTAAAERVAKLLANSKDGAKQFLRIAIKGGGCNGYSYKFSLEESKNDGDFEVTHPAVPSAKVIIDPISLPLLNGVTVDFEETLEASQFVMKNPNAKSSCGCGSSFSA